MKCKCFYAYKMLAFDIFSNASVCLKTAVLYPLTVYIE